MATVSRSNFFFERNLTSYNVSPERPWLGLRSFSEDTLDYFFGRDDETRELFDRILHRRLTVVFGQSGLGKTSLLQAGLVPRLRESGYEPISVRLQFDTDAVSLEEQVIHAVCQQYAHLDDPAEIAATTGLWQLFHDTRFGFVGDVSNPPATPVIILDQFEEIFTLGEANRDADAVGFMKAISALVENHPPEKIRNEIEVNDDLYDRLVFVAQPVKILISLRDDYLHRLERWRSRMPSMMDNRFELRLLSGPQAFRAVREPAHKRCVGTQSRPIVDDATAKSIVRFVAGAPPETPLDEIANVPPLLSLICQQLNQRRLAEEKETIEKTSLGQSAPEVLDTFFADSFEGMSSPAREFVEENLVSDSGYRESMTWDSAAAWLRKREVDDADSVLQELVHRRLLAADERGGVSKLELTHDILAPIALKSRAKRRQRDELEQARKELVSQRRKARLRLAIMAVLIALTLVGIVTTEVAMRAKKEAITKAKEAAKAEKQAEESMGLVLETFAVVPVKSKQQKNVSAREVIEIFHDQLKTTFDDQPLRKAKLLHEIVDPLLALGDEIKATEAAEEAVRIRTEHLQENDPDRLASVFRLARALAVKGEVKAASDRHRDCLERRIEVLGKEDPATIESMYELAVLMRKQQASEESVSMLETVIALREDVLGRNHVDTVMALHQLGRSLSQNQQFESAAAKLKEVITLYEGGGLVSDSHRPADPELNRLQHVRVIQDLALLYVSSANLSAETGTGETSAQASSQFVNAIVLSIDFFGEDHAETLRCKKLFKNFLLGQGMDEGFIDSAIRLVSEFRDFPREQLTRFTSSSQVSIEMLLPQFQLDEKALFLSKEDKETLQRRAALVSFVRMKGAADWYKDNMPGSSECLLVNENLALIFEINEFFGDAKELYEWVVAERMNRINDDDLVTVESAVVSMNNHSRICLMADAPQDAIQIQQQALSISQEKLGDANSVTGTSMVNLGVLYHYYSDQNAEFQKNAEEMFRKAFASKQSLFGSANIETLNALLVLAWHLLKVAGDDDDKKSVVNDLVRQHAESVAGNPGIEYESKSAALKHLASWFQTEKEHGQEVQVLVMLNDLNYLEKRSGADAIAVLQRITDGYKRIRKPDEAVVVANEFIRNLQDTAGDEDDSITLAMEILSKCLVANDEPQAAVTQLNLIVERQEKKYGPYDLRAVLAVGKAALIRVRLSSEEPVDDAIVRCRKALSQLNEPGQSEYDLTVEILGVLSAIYWEIGDKENGKIFAAKKKLAQQEALRNRELVDTPKAATLDESSSTISDSRDELVPPKHDR